MYKGLKETKLESLIKKYKPYGDHVKISDYIPELSKADPNDFGVYIIDKNGEEYFSGEYNKKFTMQSISKVLTLMLALLDNGEEYVFSKIGMEPSGDPFNSIRKLESSKTRRLYNPMINAGAIAVTSMIKGKDLEEKTKRVLDFFRKVMEDDSISVNEIAYKETVESGNKNRSMGYFLKSEGIILGDAEETIDLYFKHCSIEVSAKNLAQLGAFLAREGKLSNGEKLVPYSIIKIVKTIMFTCGFYDRSGELAVKIGLPSACGISGGILSFVPGVLGIGVYGPNLDDWENSLLGVKFLEEFVKKFDIRVL
nr:glutaminase A [uncultured Cetobacterium sp.]